MNNDLKAKANSTWLKILNIQGITAVVPLVVLVVVASILNPVFLKPTNLATLGGAIIGIWGLFAIGQAYIIIAGEIDLSMGGLLAFAAVFFSYMLLNGMPIWLAIIITFAITIAVELINAFVVLKLNVPVFIATLGMQYICKGLAKVVNYGAAVTIYSSTNPAVKQFCDALSVKPLGLSLSFWCFIILMIAAHLLLKKTRFGRQVYAVGDNKNVAKMAGINVAKVKVLCYLMIGVLVGLSSVLWVGISAGSAVTHGVGWEFIAISACAMGGVSLVGGRGSMIGVLLGVITMGVIYNVISLLGINVNYQNIFVGLFLAFAVIFDVIRREKTLGKNI